MSSPNLFSFSMICKTTTLSLSRPPYSLVVCISLISCCSEKELFITELGFFCARRKLRDPSNYYCMDNVTIFGHMDTDLDHTVRLLRQNNISVVVRSERDLNRLNIEKEEREKLAMANASSKGKEKATYSDKRKENTVIQVETNGNVISKRQLAQRARRERERLERPPIRRRNNIGVVIHDDCDVNRLDIVEGGIKSNLVANVSSKAEEKISCSCKGKENIECPRDWSEIVREMKRINTTKLLRWGYPNEVVVQSPNLRFRIRIDTRTFRIVMQNKYNHK